MTQDHDYNELAAKLNEALEAMQRREQEPTQLAALIRSLGGGPGIVAICVALGLGTTTTIRSASTEQADQIASELAAVRRDVSSIRRSLERVQREQQQARERVARLSAAVCALSGESGCSVADATTTASAAP